MTYPERFDVIARARRLANDMARHIIGENDPTGTEEACARCVDLAIAALSDAAAQADALRALLTRAEKALDHVEAVLSIVQPRSHTREYLETLDQVRGVLATIAEYDKGRS
jgi:hypothetical protein